MHYARVFFLSTMSTDVEMPLAGKDPFHDLRHKGADKMRKT